MDPVAVCFFLCQRLFVVNLEAGAISDETTGLALFQLYDPGRNKYQQFIFGIAFGLTFKQPTQNTEFSQTRDSLFTVGNG